MSKQPNGNGFNYLELEILYLKKFFSKVASQITLLIVYLKRRFLYILAFIIIGLSVGIYNYNAIPIIYNTFITANSSSIDNDVITGIVDGLDGIIQEHDADQIEDKLGVSSYNSQFINKIEAYEMFKKDTTAEKYYILNRFQIKITSTSNEIIDTIVDNVLRHINANAYINKKYNIQNEQYKKAIALSKYTAINSKYFENLDTTVLGEVGIEVKEIARKNKIDNRELKVKEIYEIIEKMFEYEQKLQLNGKIDVIDQYTIIDTGPSVISFLYKYLRNSILLSFLFLVVLEVITNPRFRVK